MEDKLKLHDIYWLGRQMVRHQFTGSSGFDSHPEIFCNLKNFEGVGLV